MAHHIRDEDGPLFYPPIMSLLIGDCLGEGAYRRVYELRGQDDKVLKVEYANSKHFNNVNEWECWQTMQHSEWAPWFAPCIDIDRAGLVLIQQRAEPMTVAQWADLKLIPAFFSDVSRRNWGMIEGRPVCVDYALNKLLDRGRSKVKLIERPTYPEDH